MYSLPEFTLFSEGVDVARGVCTIPKSAILELGPLCKQIGRAGDTQIWMRGRIVPLYRLQPHWLDVMILHRHHYVNFGVVAHVHEHSLRD